MLLERYYDDALAQASYLIGCEATGEAIVIDPNRDVERYTRAAAAHRMRIRYVTETHVHADFLSGSRDLARTAHATLLLSDHGGADWSYRFAAGEDARLVRDGESVTVGKVKLDVWHTPGHTPEHIVFLVTDTAVGTQPMGMVSGDFLFVGDVGRPDLLEKAAGVAGTMEAAAKQLFQSLRRLKTLPDYLQVWPGHGSGSACGKALGSVPQTTLGYERLFNPALRHKAEADFVQWVLADQPDPPPYFATMKRLNRDGAPARAKLDEVPQLDAPAVEAALRRGDWVVDIRGSADFATTHIRGTINIPASKSLPTYAGTVLDYDRPINLIARSHDQAQRAMHQLALIGLDNFAGWAALDVLQQWKSSGRPVETTPTIDAEALMNRLERGGPRVIDVRNGSEWDSGHLAAADHMYLGDLARKAEHLRKDEPIVVHCQAGTRASVAASLLARNGFTDVTVFSGGVDGWKKAGLPLVKEQE
jgi:hydroxyacylglutathione hydrolase